MSEIDTLKQNPAVAAYMARFSKKEGLQLLPPEGLSGKTLEINYDTIDKIFGLSPELGQGCGGKDPIFQDSVSVHIEDSYVDMAIDTDGFPKKEFRIGPDCRWPLRILFDTMDIHPEKYVDTVAECGARQLGPESKSFFEGLREYMKACKSQYAFPELVPSGYRVARPIGPKESHNTLSVEVIDPSRLVMLVHERVGHQFEKHLLALHSHGKDADRFIQGRFQLSLEVWAGVLNEGLQGVTDPRDQATLAIAGALLVRHESAQ